MLGLLRAMSLILNFPGLGAGEFRVRDVCDDVSDFAGDGDARTGTSNLAGLAELEGIVMGLSRGDCAGKEDDAFMPRFVADNMFVVNGIVGGIGGSKAVGKTPPAVVVTVGWGTTTGGIIDGNPCAVATLAVTPVGFGVANGDNMRTGFMFKPEGKQSCSYE